MPRSLRTLLLLTALTAAPHARAVTLPPDFVAEPVTPGQPFALPTAVAFSPSGRAFVAEKAGRLWAVQGGVRVGPLLDLTAEVLSNGDRGLLGLAVSPQFASDRTLFLYYTVDPDSNGIDDDDNAWQRLIRVQLAAADSNAVDPASRAVLIGTTWADGVPDGSAAHAGGALRFGRDGTLLVTTGDGAQYATADAGGLDAPMFAPGRVSLSEDIGAYRANMLGSLAGKVLRIDPASGLGLASNPYFDGDPASKRSRVWATGFRNPFRAALRPGTGSLAPGAGDPGALCVGDVGWQTWEDLHVVAEGGLHAGWPCFEGPAANSTYAQVPPAHDGCATLGTPQHAAAASPPVLTFHHLSAASSVPPGAIGNSIIGGEFYRGDRYPSAYWGGLFLSDFGQDWIKVAAFDASHRAISLSDFATEAGGAVDFATDPVSNDLHYLAIFTGHLMRIRYTGPQPNRPPVAVVAAAPRVGVRPLQVSFTSAGSSDADGDPLTASWAFGNGSGASGASAIASYGYAGRYDAVLTLDDGRGGIGRDTAAIVVAANALYPTTPVRDGFARTDGALDSGWLGDLTGLAIAAQQVRWTGGDPLALWPDPAGAEQEAFVRVAQPGGVTTLVLKSQAADTAAARLEVRWDAAASRLSLRSRASGGAWTEHGARLGVSYAAGDTLGARAFSNGIVVVHRGAVWTDTLDASSWPHAGAGGHAGFALSGSALARLDDWGGGDAVLDPDQPPVVTITSPADSSFFVVGDTLRLRAVASDAEDPEPVLAYQWSVDLRHNNHVHPAIASTPARTLDLPVEDHDDGTGVWYQVRLAVTDSQQHTVTRSVSVFPEVDLAPAALTFAPETLGMSGQAEARFCLHNLGRMGSARSRWRLTHGASVLAEGDTSVAAGDSVRVVARFATLFAAGSAALRVTADALESIPEPDESNQSVFRTLPVTAGPTRDALAPRLLSPPTAAPAASEAHVRWRTDEPARGVVHYGLTPALGDSTAVSALGLDVFQVVSGLPLGTRVHFRAVVRDTLGHATISPPDSFETQPSSADANDRTSSVRLAWLGPNPARGSMAFELELPHASQVAVRVLDVAGREVWREAVERSAGRHRIEWPGAAPAGLYLLQVRAAGQSIQRRLVRLR